MAIQLKIDEMLEALHNLADQEADANEKKPKAERSTQAYDLYSHWAEKAEELANELADVVAEELNIAHGPGEFEGMAFAGLCVPFYAKEEGQEIPDAILGLDEGGEEDWNTQTGEQKEMQEMMKKFNADNQARINRNN